MFELDIHFPKALLIFERYVIGFPFPQGNSHAKTSEHVGRLSQQAICSFARNERGFCITFNAASLYATWEIQCVNGAKLLQIRVDQLPVRRERQPTHEDSVFLVLLRLPHRSLMVSW